MKIDHHVNNTLICVLTPLQYNTPLTLRKATSLVEFPPPGQACKMAGNMCLSTGWEPMGARVSSNSRPFSTPRNTAGCSTPSVVLPIDAKQNNNHNHRSQFMHHHSTHTWFINKVEYILYVYIYIIIEWKSIIKHRHGTMKHSHYVSMCLCIMFGLKRK
jgi:hypothetical protein